MAKSIIQTSKETQLRWGIELFHCFLQATKKTKKLSNVPTLLKQLAKLDPNQEQTLDALNQVIDQFNQALKELKGSYLPFPNFSLAINEQTQSAILDQLDMVERTLTEMAKAHLIEWNIESALFGEVLKIFSQVEKETTLPTEGMARLVGEIKKINKSLPKGSALPLPDLSAYKF